MIRTLNPAGRTWHNKNLVLWPWQVVDKNMQERMTIALETTADYTGIGIMMIAVGRDGLKCWNEGVVQTQQQQQQQRYCLLWKEMIASVSFHVCSLVDGDHFPLRRRRFTARHG